MPAKPKRRWYQYSLRGLLLITVSLAFGTAIWSRWPISQTKKTTRGTETFKYHRGLWGELIRHGVHRQVVHGEVVLEEHYREELLHGSYRMGSVITGEYYAGQKHGTWEYVPLPVVSRRAALPLEAGRIRLLLKHYRSVEHCAAPMRIRNPIYFARTQRLGIRVVREEFTNVIGNIAQ